jgi:hypothetical protein
VRILPGVYSVDTPTGRHCTRHDVDYERGEVCHQCVTDPADAPGGESGDAEYQRTLRARISELRSRARKLWRVADDLLDGSERDVSTACKAVAEHTKLERLAEELQDKHDNREHELRLIRHEEAMSKVRNSH